MMTDNWWEETSQNYSRERSLELTGLMKKLVDRDMSTGFDAFVDKIKYEDGTTKLQCFGPVFEYDADVPLSTIYVLLGNGFVVQMRYIRYSSTDKVSCVLEYVEGDAKAKQWLLHQLERK